MISYSNLCENDVILEVGPGFGFLTRLLSEVAKQVNAIELDPKLLKALKNGLGNKGNISIVLGDILDVELPKFNKVVANPPYYISSPLIMILFSRGFERAVLTLQKEFAEKLTVKVGARNYGPFAVIADYKAHVTVLEDVPRESFYPQPKVESVVVLIKSHKPKFKISDEKLFFEVVEYLFTQRNRKVKKPLESFLMKKMGIDKAEAKLIIRRLPFVETRVCNMKPEDFGALSTKIHIFLESKR